MRTLAIWFFGYFPAGRPKNRFFPSLLNRLNDFFLFPLFYIFFWLLQQNASEVCTRVLHLYMGSLLFFAVYVIYKKNYSFSRVVFLFFIRPKLPTLLIQKEMTAVGLVRTTRFSSSKFRVRVTALPKNSTIYPQHFPMPEISEILTGSPTKTFDTETKNFRRKNLIMPPLIYKNFGCRKFSETEHRRVPLRNFSALWDKKIWQKNMT